MNTPGSEPTAASEIKALEAELVAVRKQRVGMQRAAAEAPGVLTATERVERDRSALSSVEVEELRGRVQGLHDELVASWDGVDRQRHMLSMLRTRYWADYQLLEEAFSVEAHTRIEATEAAKREEVRLVIPAPAPTLLPTGRVAKSGATDGVGDGAGVGSGEGAADGER